MPPGSALAGMHANQSGTYSLLGHPMGAIGGTYSGGVNAPLASIGAALSNPPSLTPPLPPAMPASHSTQSKVNHPAYSSPHLKNVGIFAETRMTKSFGCFAATFAGFTSFPAQPGVPVSSPVVEIEGHQWSVRVYACGVDESATGFISCYVVHESDEPIRAAVKITLINAKFSSDNHVAATDTDKLLPGRGSTIGWAKFIHQASYSRYCLDDVLVLRIDLTLFSTPKQVVHGAPRKSRSSEHIKTGNVVDSLSAILFDTATADVSFIVGEKTIPAHKFILALRSNVFRALFGLGALLPAQGGANGDSPDARNLISLRTNGLGQDEVVLQDMEAATVQEFVRFLYTDSISSDVLRLHYDQLLTLSCRFQVVGLMTVCASHTYSMISTDNVARILRAADACNASELRASALAYIVKYAKEVVQNADFFDHLTSDLSKEVILALASANLFGK